jgi:hypothetical protein
MLLGSAIAFSLFALYFLYMEVAYIFGGSGSSRVPLIGYDDRLYRFLLPVEGNGIGRETSSL